MNRGNLDYEVKRQLRQREKCLRRLRALAKRTGNEEEIEAEGKVLEQLEEWFAERGVELRDSKSGTTWSYGG